MQTKHNHFIHIPPELVAELMFPDTVGGARPGYRDFLDLESSWLGAGITAIPEMRMGLF